MCQDSNSIPEHSQVPPLDPPSADMIPRQYCPQCQSPLANEALKCETLVRRAGTIGRIRLTCEHCDARYVAFFGWTGSSWRFRRAEMERQGKRLPTAKCQVPIGRSAS